MYVFGAISSSPILRPILYSTYYSMGKTIFADEATVYIQGLHLKRQCHEIFVSLVGIVIRQLLIVLRMHAP